VLEPIGNDLWTISAPLRILGMGEIGHRMTVARLPGGMLWVHSPVAWSARLAAELESLGRPRWFIAPNNFHDLYWREWIEAYPDAEFLAPQGYGGPGADQTFATLAPGKPLPREWEGRVEAHPLAGMRWLNEWTFIHVPSRTLIVADLLMTYGREPPDLRTRVFASLAGARKSEACRLFRAFIRERRAFAGSLEELLAADFERIVVGHGPNIDTGGADALRKAFSDYLGQSERGTATPAGGITP